MVNVLSFGINYVGDNKGIIPGIHAEIDGLNKLNTMRNKKKCITINLLIIRFSKNHTLQSSKPCYNCICSMIHISKKKGYNIKHIFYSDNNNIVKSNLKILMEEEKHICSFINKFRN
jgi:hypothetical protein